MRFLEILKDIFYAIGSFFRRLFPNPDDSDETTNFKKTIYLLLGSLLLMGLVAVITFVIFVQPLDETVIPNLIGEDFRDAINILQTKKLVPVFDFKFTNLPTERDKVIQQDPKPREKVRIGSRVNLLVSKGIAYDRLGNYLNRSLKEVQKLIKTFNSEREIIRLKEPINYITNKAAPGTILAQYPLPGTAIGDDPIELELTVSKGPQTEIIKIGDYCGRNFQEVLPELQTANLTFVFLIKTDASAEDSGKIISQNIEAGKNIDPAEVLVLEMAKPKDIPEGKVFGVYTYNIPDLGTPVFVKVEASVLGRRTTLLSQERYGGRLTLPYILDKNAEIIITVANEEKKPERVRSY